MIVHPPVEGSRRLSICLTAENDDEEKLIIAMKDALAHGGIIEARPDPPDCDGWAMQFEGR